jgi:DNA-binding beta-propeller fold protein YncE
MTPAQTGRLLAINEGESTLSIINPRTGKEVARVEEGGVAGHEVVASADGRTAYVPIYGDSSAGDPGSDGSELVAIDLVSHKIVGHVDFGHGVRPHQPTLNPHDGMLYVTTELDKTLTIIDPKTMTIVGAIPTGQALSHMLVMDHEGRLGYTANIQPGTISVLDIRARKLLTIIPIAAKIQRIAISADDRRIFTTDQTEPRVAVIDTETKDGRWLLVGIQSTSQVAVIDLKLNMVTRTIDLPKSPHEILLSPDGATAYVACTANEHIAAIRISDWKVTKLIKAGTRVDGLAWANQR